MNDYLTIKQAATVTSKSTVTIRRLIKHLLNQDPNTPHVKQEQLNNGQQQHFISQSYLEKLYASDEQKAYATPTHEYTHEHIQEHTQEPTALTKIIAMLQQELDRKQQQLEEKDRQIASHQQREKDLDTLVKAHFIKDNPNRLILGTPRQSEPIDSQPDQEPAAQPLKKGFFWQRPRRRFK